MKKFNDLKPYYMSLKIGPEAQPMNIGSITQVLFAIKNKEKLDGEQSKR